MVPLRDSFPDGFHDLLKLLHGPDDPALDELQLGPDRRAQLLHRALVLGHAPDSLRRLGVLPHEVVFAGDGVEKGGEVRCKPRARGEHR